MKKSYKTFGLLLLIVLLLLALTSGCRTHVGVGLGFGRGKSSLKLKVSSAPPKEMADIWAMQGITFLSEEGQQITHTFPKGKIAERKV